MLTLFVTSLVQLQAVGHDMAALRVIVLPLSNISFQQLEQGITFLLIGPVMLCRFGSPLTAPWRQEGTCFLGL